VFTNSRVPPVFKPFASAQTNIPSRTVINTVQNLQLIELFANELQGNQFGTLDDRVGVANEEITKINGVLSNIITWWNDFAKTNDSTFTLIKGHFFTYMVAYFDINPYMIVGTPVTTVRVKMQGKTFEFPRT